MKGKKSKFSGEPGRPELNPTLNLTKNGDNWSISWKHPDSGKSCYEIASNQDLLALKVVSEGITLEAAAAAGGVPVYEISRLLRKAARKGIVFLPLSRIKRDESIFFPDRKIDPAYLRAETFTLQWHITHACDLHCRHCYDRSSRSPLTLREGLSIIDDLKMFCKDRHVTGHICFSGGNPFMHPDFFKLYKSAAEKGFSTSVLGNPVSRSEIEKLVSIQKPGYFQISLEGLRGQTDFIRGEGYYEKALAFLGTLNECGVPSAVMLTLTDRNIDEVIPLAESLKGKADHFTFNRLSLVGEGAHLNLPAPEKYKDFLGSYIEAFKKDKFAGYKDNLINIVLDKKGMRTFSGCTGYGCGAAFNFLAVLPDGEAHACRKFPSPLGNVRESGFSVIYDSDLANRYRLGSRACDGCKLRHVCGGCLAIAHSFGLNVFEGKDPFCFFNKEGNGGIQK